MFTKKKSSLYYRNMGENAAFRLMQAKYLAAVEKFKALKERFEPLFEEKKGKKVLKFKQRDRGLDWDDQKVTAEDRINDRLENVLYEADMEFEQFLHVANGRGIRVKKMH